ncbi:MAG: protocatechuate 3,4-dioxygenase [Planctomycetota bacterium]
MSSASNRRRFLAKAAVASGFGASLVQRGFSWEPPTASATKGPFYPVPEIAKQKYYDADLTRLDPQSPVADGEQIIVRGVVVDMDEKPLDQVIVEVWQACASGRYNHPQDKNDRPADPNFQYWARILTGTDGAFSFRTIQPGKYPGRTPHIHYRLVAPTRPELVTQMYFESQTEYNKKDGIYMELKPEQRKAVTVGFESKPIGSPSTDVAGQNDAVGQNEKLPTGHFRIVLGPKSDAKATQPM